MCGRIKQAEELDYYEAKIQWRPSRTPQEYRPSHNVPPGTRPIVLHRLGDGAKQADRLFWG